MSHAYEIEPRLKRRREVCKQVGASGSTLYRWISQGRFPPPIRIGDNIAAWDASAVDRWVAGKIEQAARAAASKAKRDDAQGVA